jgi:hypothetical protein
MKRKKNLSFFDWAILNFLLHPHENQLGFHMKYHLFLHYELFLQNPEKDFIPTLLHTTVTKLAWLGQNS